MSDRERLYNLAAMEPSGFRTGWAPEEQRVVLQLGSPTSPMTFGLSVEMAEALAEALRSEAHKHRPKIGRSDV